VFHRPPTGEELERAEPIMQRAAFATHRAREKAAGPKAGAGNWERAQHEIKRNDAINEILRRMALSAESKKPGKSLSKKGPHSSINPDFTAYAHEQGVGYKYGGEKWKKVKPPMRFHRTEGKPSWKEGTYYIDWEIEIGQATILNEDPYSSGRFLRSECDGCKCTAEAMGDWRENKPPWQQNGNYDKEGNVCVGAAWNGLVERMKWIMYVHKWKAEAGRKGTTMPSKRVRRRMGRAAGAPKRTLPPAPEE